MALKAFTRNYEDNSTEAGFSLHFIAISAMTASNQSLSNKSLTKEEGF